MLSDAQLLGRDERHLVALPCGQRMHPEAARAWTALQAAAQEAGFALAAASAFRSFHRQAAIWNGKLSGERPVHDDSGRKLTLASLPAARRLSAVLRYSALPGGSRHHWGTDVDVFDAAALAPGQAVQLSPDEVAPGGPFDALHRWLDARIAAGTSFGFYRPYARDLGGTAVERWHLSYAPLAAQLAPRVRVHMLRAAWEEAEPPLLMCAHMQVELPRLLQRYGPASVCPPPPAWGLQAAGMP